MRFVCAITALVLLPGIAYAQSTSGVSGPGVKPGTTLGLAAGIARDDGETGYAQRLDIRHGVNDRLRLGVLTTFKGDGDNYRFRYVELETTYQFARNKGGWNSAIRTRGRIPDGNDGPGRVRLDWLNSWRPSEKAEFRLMGLVGREFGDARRSGLMLETRAEATYAVAPKTRIGAQIFNNFNTTADFGSLSEQRHFIGAVVKHKFPARISLRANVVHGLTDAASDVEFRMSLGVAL